MSVSIFLFYKFADDAGNLKRINRPQLLFGPVHFPTHCQSSVQLKKNSPCLNVYMIKRHVCHHKQIQEIDLPIDIHLHLFESIEKPILLYECEVWGFDHTKDLERVHL